MQLILHQTMQTIGDFETIFKDLEKAFTTNSKGPTLHLFPELYLTGYPLQDLCLQRPFIDRYLSLIEKIDAWSKKLKQAQDIGLIGGLHYEFDQNGLPLNIENVIYKLVPGQKLECLYTKRLLPNYDIFDEKKYFTSVNRPQIHTLFDKRIGVMICEDMWSSTTHNEDPTEDLIKQISQSGPVEAIINISASPFFVGKHEKRIARAKEISHLCKAPFYYVNRIGGEDEILFDGQSFAVNGDEVLDQAKRFIPQDLTVPLPIYQSSKKVESNKKDNTWESLFSPSFESGKKGKTNMRTFSEAELAEMLEGLCFGFQQYAQKCGFSKFTIALSGGIDSALVLTIARLSLGENQTIEAVYMPGLFSAGLSYDLSSELCKNLGVRLYSLPIKFFHSSIKNAFTSSFGQDMQGLADENIQSRLRGALIYARSNQIGSMVINTSNKSEIAVGYSTQYGDSVGAISMLGDLYKTEVYQLSQYINKRYNNLLPVALIERAPTAELRENQKDQDSLPPYEELDCILEGILCYRLNLEQIVELGFKREIVEKVYRLYKNSEYKRRQFCPIIKVKSKSFGFGYRVPITHKY
ncbi:MAG: hypothetical protein COW00_16720 [Bdellovibrio sp. CG12_big_fil_rev_8_21_14_0_65_39_13]|nr:MAG: hypothetical protein COW78_10010 [Bdellovibrio sp. CG22_combo_CG10-13_8_21_14_all_39_27]PIQ58248.1 MAG: hypothetical protein COW00_16720 [Bdellovibrio sp. CG12_big_fil_rev_8_21_14_0_65_39_13]PIR36657.1 MAG: hypothetical protein COV37_02240 [Bdellovibrio sp. CG11_big_fil_rev_8_21_14_0_20_39_38]PJB53373.1 MAG: hypothetical protein CO099_07400 [Bdellovibrio sp. CG_4_9_14_3_um_filter_39_7]